MVISTLKDIKSESINVCFVKGNRQVSNKNVKSKAASIDKYGIIIPLMYVKGEKAVEDGCELVTSDGEPIPCEEADKYIVIIDGQNRYTAAIKSGVSDEEIRLFENYVDATTKELLAEANIEVEKWKGEDYIAGATLAKPENELLQFANNLSLKKFPISTISLILCWEKHKFTSPKLSKLMKGETVNIDYNIERAKTFLNAMSKFADKFIAKNYAINVVINLSSEMGYRPVCEALSKIPEATVQRIEGITGEENVKSFLKDAINKELGN
jgi:hypothetical protein